MDVHWKKSTNESKGKPKNKFDKAIGACTESTDLIL
jgi:hypothetical protein